MSKVLITGGAGFIGSNLCKFIRNASPSTHLVVLDDLSTGLRENVDELDVEFFHGSILDKALLGDALNGVEQVVHLAAIPSVPRSIANPIRTHEANITGTLNVLDAAKEANVQHVIVASSSSVYGSNPNLPKSESDWTSPLSPYGVSKLATEAYAIAYQHSFGLRTLAFRFFNVYGPGQSAGHAYAAVIPQFIDSVISQKAIPINGDGLQARDFTYVESVCEAIWQALVLRLSHDRPINLAFNTKTTLLELVNLLEQITERNLPLEFYPDREGDVKYSMGDNSLFRELLPQIVPTELEEGLKRTFAWVLSNSTKGA